MSYQDTRWGSLTPLQRCSQCILQPQLTRQQSSCGCRFNPDYRQVTIHLYPVMANRIRADDPCGFNKGRSSKFRVGFRVRQTPEIGRRTYRPKHCGNNNKDEDNNPKTLNDKNRQASSQTTYHESFQGICGLMPLPRPMFSINWKSNLFSRFSFFLLINFMLLHITYIKYMY